MKQILLTRCCGSQLDQSARPLTHMVSWSYINKTYTTKRMYTMLAAGITEVH